MSPWWRKRRVASWGSRYRWSMRRVLKELERRMRPCTSYPFASSISARYEPSCPVTPVINAFFMMDFLRRRQRHILGEFVKL
jgi:hypothetical protein